MAYTHRPADGRQFAAPSCSDGSHSWQPRTLCTRVMCIAVSIGHAASARPTITNQLVAIESAAYVLKLLAAGASTCVFVTHNECGDSRVKATLAGRRSAGATHPSLHCRLERQVPCNRRCGRIANLAAAAHQVPRAPSVGELTSASSVHSSQVASALQIGASLSMAHPRPSRISHSRQRPKPEFTVGTFFYAVLWAPAASVSSPQIGLSDEGLSGLQPTFVPIGIQHKPWRHRRGGSLKSPSTPRRRARRCHKRYRLGPDAHRLTGVSSRHCLPHHRLCIDHQHIGHDRHTARRTPHRCRTCGKNHRSHRCARAQRRLASSPGRGGVTLKTPAAFCVIGFTARTVVRPLPIQGFPHVPVRWQTPTGRIVLTASAYTLKHTGVGLLSPQP